MSANTIQPTDGELLMRFVDSRDEAAFRELVERHGGLVQAVCRRVLRSDHDVEDAFQATFLVLVRDAAAIRSRESVASWLFKVAHRVAVRAAVERQRRREQRLPAEADIPSPELSALEHRQTFELLAAELNRLPEPYRNAILVFYLEGRSREDAAEQLDCTDAALKARLARGRRMLRHRLMRRGLTLSLVLGSQAAPASLAAQTVSPALVDSTAAAGVEFARTGGLGPDCSPFPLSLAQGTAPMTSLTFSKLTVAAGVLLAALCATGLGLALGRSDVHADAVHPTAAAGVLDSTAESSEELGAERPTASRATVIALQPGEASADDDIAVTGNRAPGDTAQRAHPETLDFKRLSEAEKKIEQELTHTTSIEFIQTPLRDTMEYLADVHGIPILLDERALEEVGVSKDTPISKNFSQITLNSALHLLLDPMKLTYVVDHEVMTITSQEAELKRKETRVYSVRGLMDAMFEENLIPVIEQAVATEGTGAEAVRIETLPGLLVITQSQQQHRQTHELLNQLYRAVEP